MNDIYQQLLERNTRETTPFLAIHEANATLLNQVDGLQGKCEGLERETSELQQRLKDAAIKSPGGKASEAAANAALKSETRLRDKLEKLQEELNAKLKVHADDQTAALKTTKELSDMKDLNTAQEMTISNLREENRRAEKAIEHLENQLADAMSRTQLAEQQYTGLKDTIRVLTQENDVYRKENRELETRLVGEKGAMVDEMNVLTEMVDSLKREVDMLRSYKVQEEKRRTWFGKAAVPLDGKEEKKEKVEKGMSDARQWGSFGVIPPSAPKYTIAAHAMDGTCVKYDESGSDLVATSSSDSTVKVWDTNTGAVRATLRGTSGHTFIGCDISGSLVVAGGSDKTTRVWNLRTERMVHHLVGHAHKITCVRLFGGERAVITGSADRSLKVWDISQKTYRQTTTLRHSSTSNCVDVGSDSFTAVSGHLDGGLRFWDLRTGERTADVSAIHEGGITSVQFDPTNATQVLTNSMDSSLKIVDIRTCTAVQTLRHPEFQTSHTWSKSVFSPDGRYVAAGSSSNGTIFVWDVSDGKIKKRLPGHTSGVCGIDWSRGGSSGQQVASIDRKGSLILWA